MKIHPICELQTRTFQTTACCLRQREKRASRSKRSVIEQNRARGPKRSKEKGMKEKRKGITKSNFRGISRISSNVARGKSKTPVAKLSKDTYEAWGFGGVGRRAADENDKNATTMLRRKSNFERGRSQFLGERNGSNNDDKSSRADDNEFSNSPLSMNYSKRRVPEEEISQQTSLRKIQLPPKNYLTRKPPTPVSKKTRGFIPARFKLLPIESDVINKTIINKKRRQRRKDDEYGSNAERENENQQQQQKTRKDREQEFGLSELKGRNITELIAKVNKATFESMELLDEVYDAIIKGPLKNIQNVKPTDIQALAIPEIVKTDKIDFFIENSIERNAMNMIEQLNSKQPQKKSLRRLNRPRAIILLPSRELVDQVASVSKLLSHYAKFRTLGLTSHTPRKMVTRELDMPIDIVISTPAGILEYTGSNTLSFADTRYLVIDEADTMFDAGFGDEVKDVIRNIKNSAYNQNRIYQVIIVCATLPKTVNQSLSEEFPRLKRITTPSLHKSLPHVRQIFLDLAEYHNNKHEAILEILKINHHDRTMVFCNTRRSAMMLESFLSSKNLPMIALYSDVKDREKKLEMFCKLDPQAKILVCTDIASRGVDTTFVKHVILYDFPTTVIDYLHRIGRTGRAGKAGKVTCFVTKKNRRLAERIRRNVRDNKVLS
ncbi:14341_t:CDS:2 [Ambispora leptoticha]|uniref:14341_t:CDS:1 n=1 Tax=Ambispora leptoticha TaxID=144679 RepID=A0A9N9G2I1_9GLOM|nr:14341_t:CDS:2 [Ambispora leptoticha]